MAAKIRKGDQVIVLTGRSKGKTGEVLKVMPKETRAIVQGVNMVKRHTRATQKTHGRDRRAGGDRSICRTWRMLDPKTGRRRASASAFSKMAARCATPSGPARSSTGR